MGKYLILLIGFLVIFALPVNADKKEIITDKYLPLFQEIEEQAVNNLNHLINEAYIEYERKKENNELTLPILFSYLDKGQKLEQEVDEAFETLLLQMKIELNEKGLSLSITEPFEKQYLKSKRKNKLDILKKITLEGETINLEHLR